MRHRIGIAAAAFSTAGMLALPATASRQTLTMYAVTTNAQFINHADDRARGRNENPFNADTKALAPVSKARQKGKGPYPGDEVLYRFKLYASPSLKRSIGSAEYHCEFNFDKQALCEASFTLNGGTLLASGPAGALGIDSIIAVTGGTGKYNGSRGQVAATSEAVPGVKNAHRLEIDLR